MSRKYSQKGYDEESRREQKPRKPQGPGPRPEGPRGRGLGARREDVFRCQRCGAQRSVAETVEASTVCAQCGQALHSCVNCTYFDSSARFECRQALTVGFKSKTKANDCSLFDLKVVQEFSAEAPPSADALSLPTDARSAFDALFKL